MRIVVGGACALALALALIGSVRAEECNKPLSLVTSFDLVPVKDDRAVLIPVSLNGVSKLFLVDTGGALTEITPQTADALQLPRQRTSMQLFNVSGEMSNQFARVDVQLGRLAQKDMALMIAPGTEPLGDDANVAGILAPDVLQHYDLDIDFGAHKLNLLSQDHCDGKVIYWQADAVAVVPMRKMDSGHIQLRVQLDGKDVTAMLDTGAWNTTLTRPIAETEFGLTMGSADTPRTGALDDRPDAATYHHVFKTLALEGISVSNADVEIIPDFTRQVARENATPETGSHLAAPTANEVDQAMLLGMNVLRHFHIYIAYKENKLYITPATPPSAPAAH